MVLIVWCRHYRMVWDELDVIDGDVAHCVGDESQDAKHELVYRCKLHSCHQILIDLHAR